MTELYPHEKTLGGRTLGLGVDGGCSRLAEFEEADAGNGFDLLEGGDGGGGVLGALDVNLDDGEGLALGDAVWDSVRPGAGSGADAA